MKKSAHVYPERSRRGFTLVELLIVIAILGVLSTIGIVSFTRVQQIARDAQRKNDLNQYRIALENYASKNNGVYPLKGCTGCFIDFCCGNSMTKNGIFSADGPIIDEFLPSLIPDPVNSTVNGRSYFYRYGIDPGGNGLRYRLDVNLETGGSWVICSDGRTGKVDSFQSSVYSGACPLP